MLYLVQYKIETTSWTCSLDKLSWLAAFRISLDVSRTLNIVLTLDEQQLTIVTLFVALHLVQYMIESASWTCGLDKLSRPSAFRRVSWFTSSKTWRRYHCILWSETWRLNRLFENRRRTILESHINPFVNTNLLVVTSSMNRKWLVLFSLNYGRFSENAR